MRFTLDNPKFGNYAVYLNGQIEKSAIEADDDEGWVRIKTFEYVWGSRSLGKLEKKYGKIHIVKMVDIDTSYYRHKDLIADEETV